MLQLILLRHGKSDWREPLPDRLRPLKRRGKLAASEAGHYLLQSEHTPTTVISSPATRAIETARLCMIAIKMSESEPDINESLYMGSVAQHLSALAQVTVSHWPVMMVGHNPALDELLDYLIADSLPYRSDGKLMTTAALARIALPRKWQENPRGAGQLLELRRPTRNS
ncbi:SixA phosphatase family protein [Aestuariibacter salexigens]|uniref:SixA phosphatase family protein n=1 Tax=Aestuariibacter salexigens TaxID=226010 RepID=UPI00047893EB|nr:histidine phosphatase family protein [Aestuariibacter salexigens]